VAVVTEILKKNYYILEGLITKSFLVYGEGIHKTISQVRYGVFMKRMIIDHL
jgi:hypothetical protein